MENKNVTIVDLFIDILSKNKDTQSQNMVKRLKVFIRIPECAEFLNVVIINAMGYKSQIKSTTVDKAAAIPKFFCSCLFSINYVPFAYYFLLFYFLSFSLSFLNVFTYS